ncbi:MAG TPA: hypothetical protein VIR04_07065, partial [Paralcaligenes sp.]
MSATTVSPPQGASGNLIQFISMAGSTDLRAAVVEKTKQHIVDTMAAMVSGIALNVGIRAMAVAPAL